MQLTQVTHMSCTTYTTEQDLRHLDASMIASTSCYRLISPPLNDHASEVQYNLLKVKRPHVIKEYKLES